ncbi:MAG: hypothetical protein ACJ8BF_14435 [Gemmatimonadales bacterium]
MRAAVILVLMTATASRSGMAQLPILESLFKNVSDANLFGTVAWFANRPPTLAGRLDNGDPKSGPMLGLGFEVSFDVAEFSPRKTRAGTKSEPATRDTVEVREHHADGSVLIYKPVKPKEDAEKADHRWLAELAIGYTELRGFESAVPGLDIRATVRELPAVSLYLNHLPQGPDSNKTFSWYLGFRTGLADLHGFRGYIGVPNDGVADSIYAGAGTTFQFGVLAGAVLDFGPLTFFLEPSITRRRFSSIEWTGISGTVADVLPRALDMTTWGFAAGAQISIK